MDPDVLTSLSRIKNDFLGSDRAKYKEPVEERNHERKSETDRWTMVPRVHAGEKRTGQKTIF